MLSRYVKNHNCCSSLTEVWENSLSYLILKFHLFRYLFICLFNCLLSHQTFIKTQYVPGTELGVNKKHVPDY